MVPSNGTLAQLHVVAAAGETDNDSSAARDSLVYVFIS
jgi:hypothetical protein